MPEKMISHYRVRRRLGAGGMGEVLLAQDTKLDRAVALKLMAERIAEDPNQRKRFYTEAKAASGLSHPNICVIHEVGETSAGRPFLAMEYIEGQTLDQIQQQRRIKIREAVSIGAQVADALEAAHGRGMVHRDIKPGNIMLDRRGQAKVLDFGLAKRFGAASSTLTATATSDTATGFLVGTPHYMSPEQALGAELDHRSDIFSLGVVLYELVAGQRPFLGKSVGETINKIINEEPPALGLENPLYTPALDGIILKCLAKKPEDRYASARALAEDLAKLKAAAEQQSPQSGGLGSPTSESGTRLWQLAGKAKVRPAWRYALAALVVLALFAAVVTWALRSRRPVQVSGSAQKSVAVLPFDNYSAEKDTDYLSDGLTEEITTALARIPGLKVAARNSAFTFKGRKEDLRKVGAALGVTTLLEGSVRKSGKQIRVTAQLVSAVDGFHLWSETYDSTMDNIITVQEEIARKIAERFELKAGDGSGLATSRHAAPNAEAYALYLQARQFWNKRTKADLELAAKLFTQAIDRDATYAAAHAGLASCYALLPDYTVRPQQEFFPMARAAAKRALELDPACADAHAVMGLVESYSRNYEAAHAAYARAFSLNPNHASAHHWYGVFLRQLDRLDEALRELQQAEELDPLSPIIKFNKVLTLSCKRDYNRCLAEVHQALAVFPDFRLLRMARAWCYFYQGRQKEALAEFEAIQRSDPENPFWLDAVGYAAAVTGDTARARKVLEELMEWQKRGYTMLNSIALVHLGLGEHEEALTALERAEQAMETPPDLLNNPVLDPLRSHPRFQALVKKIGLVK